MTDNETWQNCIEMWKYIVEQLEKGEWKGVTTASKVLFLKNKWLADNGHTGILLGCFFCDAASKEQGREQGYCGFCPGKKVDPKFNCCDGEYSWCYSPRKFYNKIVDLNNKRLGRAADTDVLSFRCKDCLYFKDGDCRRYPPVSVSEERSIPFETKYLTTVVRYPHVNEDMVQCGEFCSKKCYSKEGL